VQQAGQIGHDRQAIRTVLQTQFTPLFDCVFHHRQGFGTAAGVEQRRAQIVRGPRHQATAFTVHSGNRKRVAKACDCFVPAPQPAQHLAPDSDQIGTPFGVVTRLVLQDFERGIDQVQCLLRVPLAQLDLGQVTEAHRAQ